MKRIVSYLASALMFLSVGMLCSCSEDNDGFITATEDDFPQILLPWFGEWENGEPGEYKNFTRDTEYIDSVTVTPALYTTVEWFIDGEKIHEGTKIKHTFLAGEYILKIVATTTKGLSTSRTGKLIVRPADGDPVLGTKAKELWIAPGGKAKIHGSNLQNITGVIIGTEEATDVTAADDVLTFTAPNVAEGEYKIFLIDNAGQKYGAGKVTISSTPMGVTEETLWEGEQQVDWAIVPLGDTFDQLKAKAKVGSVLRVYVEETEADYHMCCAVVDWLGILTGKADGDGEGRGDTQVSGKMVIEYPLTQTSIDLIKGGNEFGLVGFGCKVTKITLGGEAEDEATVIYEGPSEKLAWTAFEDLKDSWESLGIKVGTKITVNVTADEGAQGAITTSWWNNINTGKGWEEEPSQKQDLAAGETSMSLTVETLDYLREQGFAVVGNGFVINSIVIE